MDEPVKRRRYDSPLRRERARQTRAAILRAANARFLDVGYASTTLTAVAADAGVSVDSVYAVFGSKRGLLSAVMDVNVGGDDEPVAVLDRALPQRMRAEQDQRRQLALFASGMAGELERMRPLDDVLRSAAAADPDVAAARQDQNDRQRHAAMAVVVGWLRARGPLRAGVDEQTAADVVWTLTSPEVHHMLLETRGWTRAQYERWLRDTLESSLLPDAGSTDTGHDDPPSGSGWRTRCAQGDTAAVTTNADLHLSGDPDADALLSRDPLALLLGMLLDQQIPMEKAFRGPAVMAERLGHLDAARIAEAEPEAFAAAFARPPAVHRFPGSMAGRVQELCRALVERHGGRAEAVWEDVEDGTELLRRLKALPGFGEQKARIFVALLGKQLGVRPAGWREAAGAYGEDGALRSVADVTSPETLAEVRAYKQSVKKAAKAAAAAKA